MYHVAHVIASSGMSDNAMKHRMVYHATMKNASMGLAVTRASREICLLNFNVAKANVTRAAGIVTQLWKWFKKHSNCIICLQEFKRWATLLQGKAVVQHFLCGSIHSDCCILMPSTLLHLVNN